MNLKNHDFLKLLDYTPAEIRQLLDLATDLKAKEVSPTTSSTAEHCPDL